MHHHQTNIQRKHVPPKWPSIHLVLKMKEILAISFWHILKIVRVLSSETSNKQDRERHILYVGTGVKNLHKSTLRAQWWLLEAEGTLVKGKKASVTQDERFLSTLRLQPNVNIAHILLKVDSKCSQLITKGKMKVCKWQITSSLI